MTNKENKMEKYLCYEDRYDGSPRYVIRVPNQPRISLPTEKFTYSDAKLIKDVALQRGHLAANRERVVLTIARHHETFTRNVKQELSRINIPHDLRSTLNSVLSLKSKH